MFQKSATHTHQMLSGILASLSRRAPFSPPEPDGANGISLACQCLDVCRLHHQRSQQQHQSVTSTQLTLMLVNVTHNHCWVPTSKNLFLPVIGFKTEKPQHYYSSTFIITITGFPLHHYITQVGL